VFFLKERSVCPRALTGAALKAARHRGVDISSGTKAVSIVVSSGRATGVTTDKTTYHAAKVVNCAGAWAGQFRLLPVPVRPVKGQMVCFAMPQRELLKHVVRSPEIYLIPRSDGRLLAGATVEEAGFDKRTVPETIEHLRRAAIAMLPPLEEAHVLEDWAGLRPGTPDNLPILGATPVPSYFLATGHYRDGILLAPVTARIMAQFLGGGKPDYELEPFSVKRFEGKSFKVS
jgi:glycine/D-amino acid oxidase-like deaminating enzyme